MSNLGELSHAETQGVDLYWQDYYRAVVAEMTDGPVPYQVTDSRPRRSPGYGGDGGSQNNGVPTSSVLRLRGLPFSVNTEDIVTWFNDGSINITPITTERYSDNRKMSSSVCSNVVLERYLFLKKIYPPVFLAMRVKDALKYIRL